MVSARHARPLEIILPHRERFCLRPTPRSLRYSVLLSVLQKKAKKNGKTFSEPDGREQGSGEHFLLQLCVGEGFRARAELDFSKNSSVLFNGVI